MTVDASRSPSSTGKVLWHLMMSLDGFVAGPNHSMDWMAGLSVTPSGSSRFDLRERSIFSDTRGTTVVSHAHMSPTSLVFARLARSQAS